MAIIDANNLILGRLASIVATRLLKGEEIKIVNSEKAIVSGKSSLVFKEYKEHIEIGSTEYGPYFPKRPERIMKRTIRSMLPYKRKKGRSALSKLRIYIGIPKVYSNENIETIEDAMKSRLSKNKYVKLQEISNKLGYKI